jgi:hypothetical protein
MPNLIQQQPGQKLPAVCIIVGCSKNPIKHGLCIKCWSKAKAAIEKGTTSLVELQALGMAQAESVGDPFTVELARRRAERGGK